MAELFIMDQTGDTRYEFDPADREQLTRAETRFGELISEGYTAAARRADGETVLVRSLDPAAKETLFYPRLVGG
ncbi:MULTISPECIES: hypothetical protein [unclassified Bradyrhizobium]